MPRFSLLDFCLANLEQDIQAKLFSWLTSFNGISQIFSTPKKFRFCPHLLSNTQYVSSMQNPLIHEFVCQQQCLAMNFNLQRVWILPIYQKNLRRNFFTNLSPLICNNIYIVVMKILALISGGKDSIYNLCKCIDQGYEIVALGNLFNPANQGEGTQLDSYMYQTVGTNATLVIAQALDKPIYRRPITGKPKKMTLEYQAEQGDEVEDLQLLVQDVLKVHPDIKGVSSGAIFSTYQKLRVQNICDRHGLTSVAFLWHRDQQELLQQMIDYGMKAILIKVASFGLNKTHLGKTLQELLPYFNKLKQQCQMNVCGQGGEYESLVLDCPYYIKKLEITNTTVVQIDKNEISPVAYLKINQIQLVNK